MSIGQQTQAPENTGQDDKPGVVVRPPLLYAGALVLGLVIEFLLPSSLLDLTWLEPHQRVIGVAISTCGFVLLSLCMMEFRRAGTNVPTSLPANAVVASGPYAFSRNPIYVALSLIYLGIAVAVPSAWLMGLLVPVLVIMRYGVIAREETYLERKFGEAYLGYKDRVRRWL